MLSSDVADLCIPQFQCCERLHDDRGEEIGGEKGDTHLINSKSVSKMLRSIICDFSTSQIQCRECLRNESQIHRRRDLAGYRVHFDRVR